MSITLSMREKLRALARRYELMDQTVETRPLGDYLPAVLMPGEATPLVRFELGLLGSVMVEAVGAVAGLDMRPARASLVWRRADEVRS